jgi:hypothetical protein
MNELLNSAEFLVHVAVPGAVAKPGVTAGGAGDAPSWDVEGGGACVPVPSRLFPFSRFRAARAAYSLWSRIISIQKNTIFRI